MILIYFFLFSFQITTVDKYQGLQNDFILLSLVKTKAVGHLRDVRRLVVAMSRAKLGLYILGRVSLFQGCVELQPTFRLLLQRPTKLHIFSDEEYSPLKISERKNSTVMDDMPGMVQFVYNLFQAKLEEWKTTKPELLQKHFSGKEVEEEENNAEAEKINEESMQSEHDEEENEDVPFEKIAPDDDGQEEKDDDFMLEDD